MMKTVFSVSYITEGDKVYSRTKKVMTEGESINQFGERKRIKKLYDYSNTKDSAALLAQCKNINPDEYQRELLERPEPTNREVAK